MKDLISYFIKYTISGWVVKILLVAFGVIALFNLSASLFPLSPSRQVTVTVVYPGASPEEVEEGIIIKIEDNLKSITGVEKITSVSKENTGTITISIIKGHDENEVLDDVKNAVDQINSFPTGMEAPVVMSVEPRNFAISFAITGDVDLKSLKTIARKVEDDLRAKDVISKVELSGFPDEEIEISVGEDALRAYTLTMQQVMQAIATNNIEITGGTIKGTEEEMLVRARNKGYYADDLKDLFIKTTADGRVIRLKDIAAVTDQWADDPNRSYLNADPSVLVTVQSTNEENILMITDAVNAYIEDFNMENDIVAANLVNDASVTLRQRIDLLATNGIIGFFLVLIILTMFLNYRIAFWVALAIPVSFCGMFVLAAFYGLTINVMSLFGMILVIGILVDDGIVIAENIYQHYEKGKEPIQAAVDGTMEVLPAVTSAVLTTIVAFMTFFFLNGRLGDFAPQLAFVVIATLIVSLLEGALILPGHLAHSPALSKESKPIWIEKKSSNLMEWMRDKLYAPVLRFFLDNPVLGIAIPIAMFILTIGALGGGIVKTTFFPSVERNEITVSLELPAGAREETTDSILAEIEKAAWRVSDSLSEGKGELYEIENYRMIEKIERKLGPSTNIGSLNVVLIDAENRDVQSFSVADMIRQEMGTVHNVEKLSYEVNTPFGKPVSVSLLGNDLEELEMAKQDLMDELEKLSSVKDVISDDQVGMREVNLKLKDKAYLLGLDLQSVMAQVRQGFFGAEIQRLQRGIDEVKVWVRYSENYRKDIGSLEDMRIRTTDGKEYPLSEIADYTIERGVVSINHLDGKRKIAVMGDIANPKQSVTDINEEVSTQIVPAVLSKYPNVTARYEGQAEESKKVQDSAKLVLPVVFMLMLAIIVLTFRSFGQAIVVILMVPFGFVGVAFGHWWHGTPISLLSFFGIIALLGIMVNDSLVLVSAMNQLLKEGRSFTEAVFEASVSRFRPILLTSLTTIAGLAPLILEKSFQAQFLIPMAIAIAYGLAIATLITLLLLPLSLVAMNWGRRLLEYPFDRKMPSKESVEPAVYEMMHDEEHK